MKGFYFLLVLILEIGTTSTSFAQLISSPKSNPSVAFFYGKSPPLGQLCQYDWAVLDPAAHFSPQNYCHSMSKLIAYVALGEVRRGVSYEPLIKKKWILARNQAWNNNIIIDQTQPDWQKFYLDKVIAPLWQKGFRGFFFDTLDSYQLGIKDPALQRKQLRAMEHLIQEIRRRYPSAILILNRGFPMLPALAKTVNAVMIESLYEGWNQAQHKYESTDAATQAYLFNEIRKIKALNLPIIIIDYLPSPHDPRLEALKAKIRNQGLIPWVSNNILDSMYETASSTLERKILVVYHHEADLPVRLVPAFRYLGIILEHLGYVPVYADFRAFCKEKNKEMVCKTQDEYAGTILWLEKPSEKNLGLLKWVEEQMKKKVPVVFLHGFGIAIDSPLLTSLGFSAGAFKPSDKDLKISIKDAYYVGKEMNPTIEPYDFFPLCLKKGKVLLQLKNEYGQTEDAVALTPWGGYALNPFVIYYLPDVRAKWIINPFEFLAQALRLKSFPVPDVTTENGRRFFSVHVDGDGFTSPARWLGGHIAAVEMKNRLLERFRIPTSVSVITGEISPDGPNRARSAELMKVAKSIFALPWVEVASHSFSHPFSWVNHDYSDLAQEGETYSLEGADKKVNSAQQIAGSIDFINRYLAPKDKPARLFFWTGMADPSAEQVAQTYKQGLVNINGLAGTNISDKNPSLTDVTPLGIKIGEYYQVGAPIDIDFTYVNSFLGPLYGYKRVIQTWERTDKPRRLKAMDMYYHIYGAGYPAMLKGLIYAYEWALKQPCMPIYISEYIHAVLDFYRTQIIPYKGGWLLATQGNLKEFRSPKKMGYPDLKKSINVIGFNEYNHEYYIHAGPGGVSWLRYQKTPPTSPYLVNANAHVIAWKQEGKTIRFRLKGYVPVDMTLANTRRCKVSSPSPLKLIANFKGQQRFKSDKHNLEIHIHC